MEKNYYSNKIWALVPARSGSKSIKNKNLQKIGNYSLVARAVRVAKNCKYIDEFFYQQTLSKSKKKVSNIKQKFHFKKKKFKR